MKNPNQIIRICVATALAIMAGTAGAGGLAIGTQSGSGTGNAFAGGAAAAEDASTVWYNPAGMTLLPKGKQFAIAVHAIKPSFKFENTGSTGAFAAPGTGEGGDGGDWTAIPQGYFAASMGDKWRIGLAFNSPFGLKTDYDSGWRGQFVALKSELKTYNLNLGLAYQISNAISIGGGVSYQRLELDFNNFAGAAGIARIKASDNGAGFNLGALWQVTPETRMGLTYRSPISFHPSGDATFSGLPAGNSGATTSLAEPETMSISAFTTMSPRWDLMWDATWMRWSRLQTVNFVRTSGSVLGASGSVITRLAFNWDDTWRFSVGTNYKMNDSWKLRLGVAYDKTPTNDTTRSPRVPDQDRTWVAIGAQYRVSQAGVIDFGYAHEFIRDASVNNTVTGVPGALIGKFNDQADILSVQYTHSF